MQSERRFRNSRMAHPLAVPCWPRVACEGRRNRGSCPSRDARASVEKTVHVANNVNENKKKQMVRYCAYARCAAATTTWTQRAPGQARLQRRRHKRQRSKRSARRDGPWRAAREEHLLHCPRLCNNACC